MSDKLREAAQAALEELIVSESNAWNIINDLEAALAEQKPMLEMNPQIREWVWLTDEEIYVEAEKEEQAHGFILGAMWAETKLRDKNT